MAVIIRIAAALMFAWIYGAQARAASIELASRADGTRVLGVKLEGDISPGDALKLLTFYEYYGYAAVSTVFLRSKGGDVVEAIRLGRLIRRLRLETNAPDHIQLPLVVSIVPASNHDNFVCASACFLIFVGGVNRSGDFLILHRPHLSNAATTAMSDLEQETDQKELMARVEGYLKEMDVDESLIEKMMSTSSQDGYVVTATDLESSHLDSIVPSIEEIVLRKCEVPPFNRLGALPKGVASENRQQQERLLGRISRDFDCENKQLDDLRSKAWEREHESDLQAECGRFGPLSSLETQTLIDWFSQSDTMRVRATPARKQAIMQLLEKQQASKECRADALLKLTLAALKHGGTAVAGASPPASATPDAGKLLSLTTPP